MLRCFAPRNDWVVYYLNYIPITNKTYLHLHCEPDGGGRSNLNQPSSVQTYCYCSRIRQKSDPKIVFFQYYLKKIEFYFCDSKPFFNFIVEVKRNTINILVIMNKFQKETFKERLKKLAMLKSTGAPADLAFRFEISERSVKRIVKEIRDEGTEIRYSQSRGSYVTEEDYQ